MISRFLRSSKSAQNTSKIQQLPDGRDGLSLPRVEDSYNAAQRRPLVCRSDPNYPPKWKDLKIWNQSKQKHHYRGQGGNDWLETGAEVAYILLTRSRDGRLWRQAP